MTISRKTGKALRTFAQAVVVYRPNVAPSGPWFSVPNILKEEAASVGIDPNTTMLLDEADDAAWHNALQELRFEPDVDHLSDRELESDLESLFWKLTFNQARTKDHAARNRIVTSFVRDYQMAVEAYVAVAPIGHMDVGSKPLEIVGVQIRHVTESDIATWYPDGEDDRFLDDDPLSAGDVVAIVPTTGPTPKVAMDRVNEAIDMALEAARVAIVDFGIQIHDFQLWFSRGRVTLLTEARSGRVVYWSWRGSDKPKTPGLGNNNLGNSAEFNLARLQSIWTDQHQRPVLLDLERAVRWIGRSIKARDFDDKVVALCTAQECFLSSKSSGLKTPDLAIRAMILGELTGEGFTHPGAIIDLYKLRSDVVHGSRLGVATERTYRLMLYHTLDVLYQVLQVLQDNPALTTKHKLLTFIDVQDCLPACLGWFEREDRTDHMKLQEELKRRIGQSA